MNIELGMTLSVRIFNVVTLHWWIIFSTFWLKLDPKLSYSSLIFLILKQILIWSSTFFVFFSITLFIACHVPHILCLFLINGGYIWSFNIVRYQSFYKQFPWLISILISPISIDFSLLPILARFCSSSSKNNVVLWNLYIFYPLCLFFQFQTMPYLCFQL